MTKPDFLGEMYGERAVCAPFGVIVGATTPHHDGTKRTMIGVVVSDFGEDNWTRWRGTVILIPKMIDRLRRPFGAQINNMMVDYLGLETDEQSIRAGDSFWVSEWRSEELREKSSKGPR